MIRPSLPKLASQANPVEWSELRWEEVDAFRRLNCPHDSSCGYYAACLGWQGFTCIYCPLEAEAALLEPSIPLQRERFTQAIEELKCLYKTEGKQK